jgi:hypothetical protein
MEVSSLSGVSIPSGIGVVIFILGASAQALVVSDAANAAVIRNLVFIFM